MPLDFVPGALIFDCDGTLADTMPLHYLAWREALDALGLTEIFPEPQFYALGGVPASEVLEVLKADHALLFDIPTLTEAKEAAFGRLVPRATPLVPVIDEARRFLNKIPMAVASGGQRELVEGTLTRLGIREWFSVVVGSQDTKFGKPAPDLFLLAAARLGVEPERCVVYEDAPAGLEAARRAGMRAVDVTRYIR
jgi:beta-phosphoglucomutase-like phosphatase (HAD superfamily)